MLKQAILVLFEYNAVFWSLIVRRFAQKNIYGQIAASKLRIYQ